MENRWVQKPNQNVRWRSIKSGWRSQQLHPALSHRHTTHIRVSWWCCQLFPDLRSVEALKQTLPRKLYFECFYVLFHLFCVNLMFKTYTDCSAVWSAFYDLDFLKVHKWADIIYLTKTRRDVTQCNVLCSWTQPDYSVPEYLCFHDNTADPGALSSQSETRQTSCDYMWICSVQLMWRIQCFYFKQFEHVTTCHLCPQVDYCVN